MSSLGATANVEAPLSAVSRPRTHLTHARTEDPHPGGDPRKVIKPRHAGYL